MRFLLLTTSVFLMLTIVGPKLYAQNATRAEALLKNGLIVKTGTPENFTLADYNLLQAYNFDAYRRSTEHAFIQIERGPLIELFSIAEMQQQEHTIDPAILERRKDDNNGTVTHQVITLLNIGWGFSKTGHLEVTH